MCDLNLPTTEPQEKTCAENANLRTLLPGQLQKWLGDRRKSLLDARWNLLAQIKSLEREIAAVDAMIADLTIE